MNLSHIIIVIFCCPGELYRLKRIQVLNISNLFLAIIPSNLGAGVYSRLFAVFYIDLLSPNLNLDNMIIPECYAVRVNDGVDMTILAFSGNGRIQMRPRYCSNHCHTPYTITPIHCHSPYTITPIHCHNLYTITPMHYHGLYTVYTPSANSICISRYGLSRSTSSAILFVVMAIVMLLTPLHPIHCHTPYIITFYSLL